MVTITTLDQYLPETNDLKIVVDSKAKPAEEIIAKTEFKKSNNIVQQITNLAHLLHAKNNLSIIKSKEIAFYCFLKKIAQTISLNEKIDFYENLIKDIDYSFDIDLNEFYENTNFLEQIYVKIIDSDKKRDNGQFFTPEHIAKFMVDLGMKANPINILDPAGGGGIFEKYMTGDSDLFCDIIEKDPLCLLMSKVNLCRNKSLKKKYINEDYLFFNNSKKYDLIIANPPYIRFQGVIERDNIISNIEKDLDVNISRLVNYYALFFYRAISMLKENGKLIFITPCDYLNFNYGVNLKKYIKQHCEIDVIITFDNNYLTFADNLSSACITVLTKRSSIDKNKEAKLMRILNLSNEELIKDLIFNQININNSNIKLFRYKQHELNYKEKWNNYFETNETFDKIKHNLTKLSNHARVCRGIATGANKFFILSKSEIIKWGIEEKFFKPVLEKSLNCRYMDFTESDFKQIVNSNKPSYLLYIFLEPSSNLKKYIQLGMSQKIHERYLPSKRKPWYSMEKRKPAKIWAGTFSRDGVKFILNNTNCLNLTTFHCIYPNIDDEDAIKFLVAYLNSGICKELIKREIRPMGGGLDKLQPKDIENILIPDINRVSKDDIQYIANKFDQAVELSRNLKNDLDIIKDIEDRFSKILE